MAGEVWEEEVRRAIQPVGLLSAVFGVRLILLVERIWRAPWSVVLRLELAWPLHASIRKDEAYQRLPLCIVTPNVDPAQS